MSWPVRHFVPCYGHSETLSSSCLTVTIKRPARRVISVRFELLLSWRDFYGVSKPTVASTDAASHGQCPSPEAWWPITSCCICISFCHWHWEEVRINRKGVFSVSVDMWEVSYYLCDRESFQHVGKQFLFVTHFYSKFHEVVSMSCTISDACSDW